MWRHNHSHWQKIFTAAAITAVGLVIAKFVPMWVWGSEIRFDASMHIATAMLVLYVLWFFIDQNTTWHTPYFIFSAMVLMVIAFQRIADNAHNDIGLLAGLVLGMIAIGTAERRALKNRLKF